MSQKQPNSKQNKEKYPLWANTDIDRNSMVLDSMLIFIQNKSL